MRFFILAEMGKQLSGTSAKFNVIRSSDFGIQAQLAKYHDLLYPDPVESDTCRASFSLFGPETCAFERRMRVASALNMPPDGSGMAKPM